jgi:hypothetical protein
MLYGGKGEVGDRGMKSGTGMIEGPFEPEVDIHQYFGLSYSSYLVLSRTLLQSMPEEWQIKFVEMMGELNESFDFDEEYTGQYWVRMTDGDRYRRDPYRDYNRGRKKIPLKKREG